MVVGLDWLILFDVEIGKIFGCVDVGFVFWGIVL